MLEPRDGGLAALPGAEPLFVRWFEIRRRLYEYLLMDRGEFSAKAMLTLAVERAAEAGLLGPDDWLLTDDALVHELERRSVGETQAVGQVIKRLRVGDLFECINVWRSDATEAYSSMSDARSKRSLEKALESRLAQTRAPKIRICVHYILDYKKTCRALRFHDLGSGVEKMVGHDSHSLLVGVFVTNARVHPLSGSERRRTSDAISAGLTASGLGRLVEAEEPLGVAADANRLFGE